jgi:SpoVK/Ycf46/Vps4 family AAA+-type ATPase
MGRRVRRAEKSAVVEQHTKSKLYHVLRKVQGYVQSGVQLFDAVNSVGENPKPRNVVSSVLKVGEFGLQKLSERVAGDTSDWKQSECREMFADEVKISLERAAEHVDDFSQSQNDDGIGEQSTIRIYTIVDPLLGTMRVKSDDRRTWTSFYVERNTDHSSFLRALGKSVWEANGSCVTLTTEKIGMEHVARFLKSSEWESLQSEQGDVILSRIQAFHKANINRSIMLVGDPGTGKSSMMRYVTSKLPGLSLTISVQDFSALDNEDMAFAVEMLQPNFVIVDDFDRITNTDEFLSNLEDLNRDIPLFMVSVNDPTKLSTAVMRPGRFDDVILVDKIDDSVVRRVLPWATEDIISRVKEWPVAFIAELGKRFIVLGRDALEEEIQSLHARVVANSRLSMQEEEDDDEDYERMGKISKQEVAEIFGPNATVVVEDGAAFIVHKDDK